ncbi:MAG: hypothetical protein HFJ50_01600 [Clostridia bacterium]|jgi:alpha-tubulin suppressor-like RCC1 family protein|nr:hypothetical protein [Clostridia bacterium]
MGIYGCILQSSKVYTWGRNTYGELAKANTENSATAGKAFEKGTEISLAGFNTFVKDVDSIVYGAGLNSNGQIGNEAEANTNILTKIKDIEEVNETNKIKYIKAGITGSSIMLTNGSVYISGNNEFGELGNGTNNSSSVFVKAKLKDENLEDAIMIGRKAFETSPTVPVIRSSGRVYLAGSNKFGQMGNDTKDDSNYFTVMRNRLLTYPERIDMIKGENLVLTHDDLKYEEIFFNVYKEDIETTEILDGQTTVDNNIATYTNGNINAKNVRKNITCYKIFGK